MDLLSKRRLQRGEIRDKLAILSVPFSGAGACASIAREGGKMKTLILAAVGAVLSLSAAADTMPAALVNVKGLLLTGLTTRETISVDTGKMLKCERKSVMDLITFKCTIEGVSAQVSDGAGAPLAFQFDKLFVMYKTQKTGDVVREYHYTGTWTQTSTKDPNIVVKSPTRLTLWHYRSTPKDIRGFLKLDDHSVFGSVQASQD